MNFSELNQIVKDVRLDQESLQKYGKDWTSYFDIKASAVVFPESTEQIQKLVLWARKNKISLLPSGGRTGLSGGACALLGEVIVSFEKMNQIFNFQPVDQTVQVQAGVITESLQNFAKENQLFYPVDFAARGSSHIGGNIATNAGGIKVLKYGLTRDWVTALTVVTGTGDILHLNNSLIKNATGFDLRHLFIGSEGTLGFITEATIKLTKPPQDTGVLFLSVPSLQDIMKIFAEFKLKTDLLAFEMFSRNALIHVQNATKLSSPISDSAPYYLVVEVENIANGKALEVFEFCTEQGWIIDGAQSQSETQAKQFWRLREDITESLSRFSPYKNDVAVAIHKVPDFITELDQTLKSSYPTWDVVWFGHIGDGNLHISILRPKELNKEQFVQACRKVDEMVFSIVAKYEGSISAEHGVGLTKKMFLHHTRSPAEIQYLKSIKKIFDPDLIINPGKLFDF